MTMLLGLPQKMFSDYQGEVSCLDALRVRKSKSVIRKHSIRKHIHIFLNSKYNHHDLFPDRIASMNMF